MWGPGQRALEFRFAAHRRGTMEASDSSVKRGGGLDRKCQLTSEFTGEPGKDVKLQEVSSCLLVGWRRGGDAPWVMLGHWTGRLRGPSRLGTLGPVISKSSTLLVWGPRHLASPGTQH